MGKFMLVLLCFILYLTVVILNIIFLTVIFSKKGFTAGKKQTTGFQISEISTPVWGSSHETA